MLDCKILQYAHCRPDSKFLKREIKQCEVVLRDRQDDEQTEIKLQLLRIAQAMAAPPPTRLQCRRMLEQLIQQFEQQRQADEAGTELRQQREEKALQVFASQFADNGDLAAWLQPPAEVDSGLAENRRAACQAATAAAEPAAT